MSYNNIDKDINEVFKERVAELSIGERNLVLLDGEKQDKKYLDLGFVDERLPESKETIVHNATAQVFWYYGKKLQDKDAIIISYKRILLNDTKEFYDKLTKTKQIIGTNEIPFDYDGSIGDIAPIISNAAIKLFLQKGRQLFDKRAVIQKIIDKLNYYMDFGENEEIAHVQACWVIATHCYPLFYWFPNILFNAPSDSGKSKNAFILTQLSFRGYDLGASAGVTPAQIFRTLEGNRGAIWIDEFERREKSETQQLVYQIINAGGNRDSYIIRNEQENKKWVGKKFPIFCPKIVCNISGINSTSMSRFIGFNLLKTTTEKGKRKPYKEQDKKELSAIRDEISLIILENWQEIKQINESLQLNLANRDEDNWLPICAIAKFIGEDVYQKVSKYIETYQEIRLQSNDQVVDFFDVLYEYVGEEQKYYTPKQIAECPDMQELLSQYKSPANWIGRTLRSYKFPTNRGGGVRKYLLSKINVKDIINRYFTIDKTSHNNTNNTNSTEQHRTTQNNQKNEENVSLGGVSVVIPEVTTPKIEPVANSTNLKVLDAKKVRQEILNLCHGSLLDLQEFISNRYPDFEESIMALVDDMKSKSEVIESKAGFLLKLE